MIVRHRIINLVVLGALAWLGLATGGLAAPIDFAQIAGEATWLAHLDVDAMRSSTLAARLYQQAAEPQGNAEHRLAELRNQLGIDPAKDLHGITLYGKQLGSRHGVLLVAADFDVDRLVRKVALAPDHQVAAYQGHDLHSWSDTRGGKEPHTAVGAFFRPTLLVFAPNLEDMKAAIDVLETRRPSLRGEKSVLNAAPSPGAMLAVRAIGLDQAVLPYKSPLVTQSETLRLDVVEAKGHLMVEAALGLKSSETVEQVQAILGGLRATAELRTQDDPHAAALVRRLKTEVQDKTLRIDFRASVDDLWKLVEKKRPMQTTQP